MVSSRPGTTYCKLKESQEATTNTIKRNEAMDTEGIAEKTFQRKTGIEYFMSPRSTCLPLSIDISLWLSKHIDGTRLQTQAIKSAQQHLQVDRHGEKTNIEKLCDKFGRAQKFTAEYWTAPNCEMISIIRIGPSARQEHMTVLYKNKRHFWRLRQSWIQSAEHKIPWMHLLPLQLNPGCRT